MNKSNLPEEIEREQRLWERNAKLGFLEITLCIYIWASSILGQQNNNNNKLIIDSTGRFRSPTGHVHPPATDPMKPQEPIEAATWTRSNRIDPARPNPNTRVGRFLLGRSVLSRPTRKYSKFHHHIWILAMWE
jgi:hypothetical protein